METRSRSHARQTPVGPYSRKLARRIRDLRKAHGWTQEQLAELADLETHNVSLIERAKAVPSIETVGRIAWAFRLTIAQLYPDEIFSRAVRLPGGTRRIGSTRPRSRRPRERSS